MALDFLSVNPFTQGWRSEDQFQRQRDRDLLGMEASRFSLDESRRKSAEAQMMDQVYRPEPVPGRGGLRRGAGGGAGPEWSH